VAQNKENVSIKEELKNTLDDLYRFMNMIETLLNENNKLTEHIEKKNFEIIKIIESSALNETEEI